MSHVVLEATVDNIKPIASPQQTQRQAELGAVCTQLGLGATGEFTPEFFETAAPPQQQRSLGEVAVKVTRHANEDNTSNVDEIIERVVAESPDLTPELFAAVRNALPHYALLDQSPIDQARRVQGFIAGMRESITPTRADTELIKPHTLFAPQNLELHGVASFGNSVTADNPQQIRNFNDQTHDLPFTATHVVQLRELEKRQLGQYSAVAKRHRFFSTQKNKLQHFAQRMRRHIAID